MVKSVQILGKKLAALRCEKFFSQEELADKLEMSSANIGRLEQEEVAGMLLSNFRKLAEVVKIDPEILRERIGANGTVAPKPKAETPETLAIPRFSISAEVGALLQRRGARDGLNLPELVIRILEEAAEVERSQGEPAPHRAAKSLVKHGG